jgi:hypothetical protein
MTVPTRSELSAAWVEGAREHRGTQGDVDLTKNPYSDHALAHAWDEGAGAPADVRGDVAQTLNPYDD